MRTENNYYYEELLLNDLIPYLELEHDQTVEWALECCPLLWLSYKWSSEDKIGTSIIDMNNYFNLKCFSIGFESGIGERPREMK